MRAAVEGLKAIEAVVDELAKIGESNDAGRTENGRRRIEVE